MYIDSKELMNRVNEIAEIIRGKSDGNIIFEEYITLPYYKNIILRFDIKNENYTLDDLDRYEIMMAESANNEFLVDFMGSVYKKVGLDPQGLKNILLRCRDKYFDEEITSSIYAYKIKEDTQILLNLCELPSDLRVWEIQLEEEINLLILGSEFKIMGHYSFSDFKINAYEVSELECEGLIKATMFAKRNHISLVRALLQA